jgi:hypothetical protein
VLSGKYKPRVAYTDGSRAVKATWRWRFEDASGAEVRLPEDGATGGAGGFPSQSDAESWVGEVWQDLLEDGVDQVTLFEADREVYGPMSLHTQG